MKLFWQFFIVCPPTEGGVPWGRKPAFAGFFSSIEVH